MSIRPKASFLRRAALAAAAVLVPAALFADGFIIPRPPRQGDAITPLSVKYHHVTVEIRNQVAKTTVDQAFLNPFDRDIEGTYFFPLPEGSSISEFAMWIGDQKISGEILDAREARGIYEDIVRRLKDPAILEYMGRNLFRARVFPIPAKGEKRVRLAYTEVLKAERNLVRYRYPLDTERLPRDPIASVSLSADISSSVPISNVYSPSHKISVRRPSENRATAGFEETNVKPEKDFLLIYGLSPDDVGLSFINWEVSGDGYLMVLASPRAAAQSDRILEKNMILVLDSSGSMSGPKIAQAKEAARFIIRHLGPGDRFAIIDFDDGVNVLSDGLEPAAAALRDKGLAFVDGIQDSGGTNIRDALVRALGMMTAGDRPNYVLFLTDGQPTVGLTEPAGILRDLAAANAARARIFAFGVGHDVNTELLDRITLENRGTSVYVAPDENLELALSNFYDKISSPLLADLKLEIKGVEARDVYPRALPDLFRGSQLILIGKYRGEGPVSLVLTGQVGKDSRRFVLDGQRLAEDPGNNFLPRIWATRRIGYLLEEIRLHGSSPELVDEVKKLGLSFGIVTPYTSFLVTERERLAIPAAAPEAQDALAKGAVTGKGAVTMASYSQAMKAEERAARVESSLIRYRDDKTFTLKDGVWADSAFKEGSAVKEIAYDSDEYYKLASGKPALAKYLSVAPKLIVCFEGVNYKII
jgi:Ca-activated chloride channel family protein